MTDSTSPKSSLSDEQIDEIAGGPDLPRDLTGAFDHRSFARAVITRWQAWAASSNPPLRIKIGSVAHVQEALRPALLDEIMADVAALLASQAVPAPVAMGALSDRDLHGMATAAGLMVSVNAPNSIGPRALRKLVSFVLASQVSATAVQPKGVPELQPLGNCRPFGLKFDLPPVVLSGAQLLEALDFVAPDRAEDQMESEVCIALRDEGRDVDGDLRPAGHYCWLEEYPEEGSIILDGKSAALAAGATPEVQGEQIASLPTAEMSDAGLAVLQERHPFIAEALDWRDAEACYIAMRRATQPAPAPAAPVVQQSGLSLLQLVERFGASKRASGIHAAAGSDDMEDQESSMAEHFLGLITAALSTQPTIAPQSDYQTLKTAVADALDSIPCFCERREHGEHKSDCQLFNLQAAYCHAPQPTIATETAGKLPPPELTWLYTHCRAIGMDCKSDSGKWEHDIALFTTNLTDELRRLRAETAGAAPVAGVAQIMGMIRRAADLFADEHADHYIDTMKRIEAAITALASPSAPVTQADTPADQGSDGAGLPFQQRVQPWMMACFGPAISADVIERNHRFLEESLELVQSTGCTQSEAHQLVDYVYGRPAGETQQEVGGVMVTLAALCLAHPGLDMHAAGETELARIWTKVDKIRAKQAAKPKHSPLPSHPEGAEPTDAGRGKLLAQRAFREKVIQKLGTGVYLTYEGDGQFGDFKTCRPSEGSPYFSEREIRAAIDSAIQADAASATGARGRG